jgi:Transposase DDE domain
MPASAPPCVRPTPEEVLPLFRACFSRPVLQGWLQAHHAVQTPPPSRLYWRLYTPLVVLWCLILQRLQADHTDDAVVTHLQTGAADALDPHDPHQQPLSQRLRSESTAAYVQARARLPLALLQRALVHLVAHVQATLVTTTPAATWHGHPVRLLDGTTFRLAPTPALVAAYGQASNQYGDGYWVVVRSVASFCLHTQLCTAFTEAPPATSESALVHAVMAQEGPDTVFVGDSNFGVYRVAQVATAMGQQVVLRLRADRAEALLRANGQRGPRAEAQAWVVQWARKADTQYEATLPAGPLAGRVLYVRLQQPGFRPRALYLFTTLPDAPPYVRAEVVALYGLRWQVERDYRQIKTTLEMEEFTAQSPAVFRLELAAGLLTYNLVRAVMVQAAQQAGVAVTRLSFARCWRRLREALLVGVPAWVGGPEQVGAHLLVRLAQCRLPHQPHKVGHEPRKVRRRPQVFPALKGTRAAARQQVLAELGATGAAATPVSEEALPQHRLPQRKAA